MADSARQNFNFGWRSKVPKLNMFTNGLKNEVAPLLRPISNTPWRSPGFTRIDGRPNRSGLHAAADMIGDDDAGVLGSGPEYIPRLQIHFESDIIDQEIGFAKSQLRHPDDFISRRLEDRQERAWPPGRNAWARLCRSPAPNRCTLEHRHFSARARRPAWR